jgi:hypothetical protein
MTQEQTESYRRRESRISIKMPLATAKVRYVDQADPEGTDNRPVPMRLSIVDNMDRGDQPPWFVETPWNHDA